jgi:hypothetical protein
MQPTNLLAYWGSERLRKYPGISLQGISIPQRAKEFLERIGMPVIHDPLFRFEPTEAPFQLADQANGFWKIGSYDSSPICVKEDDGGVFWYDPDNHAARFMNAGLEQFVMVLTLYEEMLKMCRATPNNQRKPIVDEAERQMKLVDPQAFTSEESYWPIVFEQIGYELD